MTRASRSAPFAALLGLLAVAPHAVAEDPGAATVSVSIQIDNPNANVVFRVRLDGKVIHELAPSASTREGDPVPPTILGPFALAVGRKHVVDAEVPQTHIKARLEWIPRPDGERWLLLRYYPGRREPQEPAFVTFALQREPYRVK